MKYLSLILIIVVFAVTTERLFLPETTATMHADARDFGTLHEKPAPPLPFVYDGCTLFPDRLPGLNLSDACLAHDVAYWHGGTAAERKAADQRLQNATAQQGTFGQIMQFPVYIGVRVFGDSVLARSFNAHWGFGHY